MGAACLQDEDRHLWRSDGGTRPTTGTLPDVWPGTEELDLPARRLGADWRTMQTMLLPFGQPMWMIVEVN